MAEVGLDVQVAAVVHDEVLAEAEGQVGAQGAGEGLAAAVEGHERRLRAGTRDSTVAYTCVGRDAEPVAAKPTCSAAPRAADAP